MSSWLGVCAPAGTPARLIARLNETVDKIFGDPPVKEKLAKLGLVVTPMSPAAMTAMIKAEIEARGALKKALSLIKKRSGPHEDTIREIQLTTKGVVIGPPLVDFQGVMTGVPSFLGRPSTTGEE
jgi:circadian clock protein KaiC